MTNYINGKIYVGDGFSEAFTVEGDRFTAVGTNEEILKNSGEVVDLKGQTVLPGLIDSHLHLKTMGETLLQWRLYDAKSIDDVVRSGKEYLKTHSDVSFIYGRGWNQDYFETGEKRFINRHDLDQISTEIPIIAERVCVHVLSCNTKALEMLGLPKEAEVEGGKIYRDENGEMLGIFAEKATELLRSIVPEATCEEIQAQFIAGAEHAMAMGITSVGSCDVLMTDDWEPIHSAIESLYIEEKMPLRYYPQFNLAHFDCLKEYVQTIYKREGIYNNRYQRGSIKLFKDGSLGARTALMSAPYHDDKSTKGVESISNEAVDQICAYASEESIPVAIHCIGDEAARRVVESYRKVNGRNNPNRNTIVHLQITDKKLLEDIADLNIYTIYQPIFLEYDITTVVDRVGKELASTSYAHNTLKNKLNAHTAYGTDAPVEDLNPFPCMYSAVTRKRFNGEPDGGFFPEECVSVRDAIDCYTIEGAYVEGTEHEKGRIKPGYLADFIILDRDIFTIDPMEIKDITVEETFIGGSSVYRK